MIGIYNQAPGGTWNPITGSTNDWYAGILAVESVIGHSIDAYTIFPCYAGRANWGFNLQEQLGNMITKRSNIIPLVGVRLFETGADGNSRFDDPIDFNAVINGDYDVAWNGLIDGIAATGCQQAIIRLAYESNFSYMPDFAGWDTPFNTMWRNAMNRALSTMKTRIASKGIDVKLALCPNIGTGGLQNYASILPTTSLWDILGVDFYNQCYVTTVTTAAGRHDLWDRQQDSGSWCWNLHIATCKSLNKPAMLFEFGAINNLSDPATRPNDGDFMTYTAGKIAAAAAAGVNYLGTAFWNIPAVDTPSVFTNGSQPAVLAAVKANIDAFAGNLVPVVPPATTNFHVIHRNEGHPRRLVLLDDPNGNIAPHMTSGDLDFTAAKASVTPGKTLDLTYLESVQI